VWPGSNIEKLDHSRLGHETREPTGNSFQLSLLHFLYYETREGPDVELYYNPSNFNEHEENNINIDLLS
jgi:hypothetical protein